MKHLISLMVTLLVTTLPTSGFADSDKYFCSGEACFPEVVTPLGLTLKKASKARYRYYGFLVFDSVLYAESPEIVGGDFLGKKPCALRLCYHRSLKASDFRESATETLALNPAKPLDFLKPQIDILHARYQTVKEGDCYQLSFKPATGTELSLNDTPIVTVPGDDFGLYYLGIWLSPFSFSQSLTKDLTTPLTY